jgi:hypothetical protein
MARNRPSMNVWLYAKCRTYLDPDDPDPDMDAAETIVEGPYDDHPTGV